MIVQSIGEQKQRYNHFLTTMITYAQTIQGIVDVYNLLEQILAKTLRI